MQRGKIGVEQVRVLTRAATATPGRRATIAEAEPVLVEAAERLGPRQLTTVVARWADAVDPTAGIADADRAFATAVQRIACDAVVTPIRWDGTGPVDIGRTTRVVPPRLQRLLVARESGRRFPGCDRPVAWCDAHHVTPWAQGGPTDQANLLLLCRRHHRAVHEGGFRLDLDRGARITVARPDGTLLTCDLPPPAWSDTG
jgi:LmbE family N-acetylglucosaminyl deacetylase